MVATAVTIPQEEDDGLTGRERTLRLWASPDYSGGDNQPPTATATAAGDADGSTRGESWADVFASDADTIAGDDALAHAVGLDAIKPGDHFTDHRKLRQPEQIAARKERQTRRRIVREEMQRRRFVVKPTLPTQLETLADCPVIMASRERLVENALVYVAARNGEGEDIYRLARVMSLGLNVGSVRFEDDGTRRGHVAFAAMFIVLAH